jgi:hypothetical protein
MTKESGYPSQRAPIDLLRGCLIHTLGQGLYGAVTGQINWMRWWDGWVYRIDNGSGDLGSVVFRTDQNPLSIAGAAFLHDSDRSPWRPNNTNPGIAWFLKGASESVVTAIESLVLPYISDRDLPAGETMATCVFWSTGERIVSNDPSYILDECLGNLMEIETIGPERATTMLESSYTMPKQLAELAADIATSKSQQPSRTFTVSPDQMGIIEYYQNALDEYHDGTVSQAARHSRWLDEFRQLVAPLGIVVP